MKRRISRALLMVAGICTVIVVLLSQSVYQSPEKNSDQTKTGQKTEKHLSVAPDVVPTPATQLDKITPSLVKVVTRDEPAEKTFFPDQRVFISFFKAFLKAAISPNAP